MTPTNLNPMYQITVQVETVEESGATRAEWDADRHRVIYLKSAVDPEHKDKFARADLLIAFRWCAGLLARLALQLDSDIMCEYEYRTPGVHRCIPNADGSPYRCGWRFEEGVTRPKWAVDAELVIPEVALFVPTEKVEHWAEHFRRRVAEMLAEDRTPLAPAAPERDHQQVVLAEHVTETKETST